MNRIAEACCERATATLRELAVRPWSLFCLLFATNALFLPYRGLFHDAILYALQVRNRIDPGRYAEDLFFAYGSQDSYSVFSLVMAPLAAQLGLPLAFFLGYLACNALFLWAVMRLVRALLGDPLVSTLALLLMAATLMPFGGLRVFHVNEAFLTPRIPANALVLLALERCLAGRRCLALVLTLLAMPLHPLMAFPGTLIVLASWVHARVGAKGLAVLTIAGLAACCAVILYVPLGARLFGILTEEWRVNINRVSPLNFPLDWSGSDWVRVGVSVAAALATMGWLRKDDPARRLLGIIAGVGFLGLCGCVVACYLPYALLFQGQSYRWTWPLEMLLYPLGVLSVVRLWRTGDTVARLGAVVIVAYLSDLPFGSPLVWVLAAGGAVLGVAGWRGVGPEPFHRDWGWRVAVTAFALTVAGLAVIRLGLLVRYREDLADLLEGIEYFDFVVRAVSAAGAVFLAAVAATWLQQRVGVARRFVLTTAGAGLAIATCCFVFPSTALCDDYLDSDRADVAFVRAYLEQHAARETPPTVYWPVEEVRVYWFELGVNCYFHRHQLAGNIFHPGTALEGRRRSLLTRPFELEFYRHLTRFDSGQYRDRIALLFDGDPCEASPPRREDLLTLCRDQEVDVAILPWEFPELSAASNGRVFIYDCREIRERLAASERTNRAVFATGKAPQGTAAAGAAELGTP